ncbi:MULTISPECIES: S8 family serine peptidase [unclassified Crossiella]|uniref:S8 family serine peptidase n=1 Tax=unclassified Crossiella TaxID=2620835 RepID=UPI0020002048|nr:MULTISPECIES: S8 family serine peptidase [unclassified Crossiella]MCK2240198.1 S8 family serine peptidase [Crossiella sp. S99.2]MCK2253350.1 S8 family serine peptidase [Crossiella sp. S99.1]
MNRRSRTLAGLVALTTVSATLAVAPPATAAPAGTPGAGTHHQVTLITGDRVRAGQRADGSWSLTVEPVADGTAFGYQQFPVTQHGRTDWYLVPNKADRLIGEGLLDRELFNITGLIRQGYDDARSPALPLLMQYPEAATTRRAAELPGTTVRRELPSLNMAAVEDRKSSTAEFWRELTHQGPGTLAGGARKIWLNGKAKANLDASVPQVGAPAAWQAGFTGKGTTVAVLDTGIDDTHPDVAGKVKHSKDFSGKGNVKDGDGHGTHVAATAVGSGAAEGGKFKGVAPEADLAVGKVLDDGGSGSFADIIAGMEWAAAEVKAKVISMSLGGGPTDGSDPMAQAVNTLSRKHNTLFVIAAGNSGAPGTVSSPASADLALTVGSVTKGGGRSDFSSQGPRVGDGAVKPEIAAPGSDIVAARATGTAMGTPVNERYTKASGTSMATPHVAGGAAILAQQHPDWTAEQIKSALVSTAVPVSGNGAFTVGGGRMDLGKAVGAQALASPSVVNAFLKWPSTKAETRTVTYTNPGTTPLTLALKLDLADTAGNPAPAGLAKLSANSVTVPAGGKAEVSVTLTPRAAKPGSYGGVLTAADGSTTVRSLLGAHEEGEHYDVNAKAIRQDGKPATAQDGDITLLRQQDGARYYLSFAGSTRVPPGVYSAIASITTPRPGADATIAMVANPEVKITKAATVSFDTRQAKRVKVSSDQPAARSGYWLSQMRQRIKDNGLTYSFGWLLNPRFSEYYSHSVGAGSPSFSYADNLRLEEADLELFTEGTQRQEIPVGWLRGSPDDPISTKLPSVYAGGGTVEELAKVEAKGKLVVIGLPGQTTFDEVYQRIRNIKAAGGLIVGLYVTDDQPFRAGARLAQEENPAVLPSVRVFGSYGPKFAEYAKTGGQLSLTTRRGSKYRYELSFPSPGKVPAKVDYPVKTADLAAITMAYHGFSETEPPIVGASVEALGDRLSTNWFTQAVASAERVEHYTPGNWEINVGGWYGASGDLVGKVKLEGGKSYRQEWNKAVNGPAFTGTTSNGVGDNHPWAHFKADLIDVTVPWWSDAAGHPRPADPSWGIDKGTTTLFADGKEVARHNAPGRGIFLRERATQYRLESDVSRDAPWWTTSTKINSVWTFGIPRVEAGALPLFNVRYAPPVNLRNLAPGDREFAIPVTVPRQDGPAEATSLTVDYSVDDGATWQQAKVDKSATGWTATVRNPAKGFVSLRGKASDGTNSVEQTVLKAYEIG